MSWFTIPGIPNDLIVSDRKGTRRLKVDSQQTGFFEGRQFRISYHYSAPVVLKFSCTVNFILWFQDITCDEDHVLFEALINPTPSGVFDVEVPIFGSNRMSVTQAYARQTTIFSGGTVTGGTTAETVSLKTSNATAQQSTIGGKINSERGLPAGDYYLKFSAEAGSPTGIYNIMWEERP